MPVRTCRLVMLAALLSSFQAAAQAPSAAPPAEQTAVTCDAFQRVAGGEKWVVLWPVTIRIEGTSIDLIADTRISRGEPLDGVDVAGVLEKICYGENPREVQTDYRREHRRRSRK